MNDDWIIGQEYLDRPDLRELLLFDELKDPALVRGIAIHLFDRLVALRVVARKAADGLQLRESDGNYEVEWGAVAELLDWAKDNSDPFTQEFQLCDDDGIVRRGAMHHGTDYPCTGHAHFGGEHIRCTNVQHQPDDALYLGGT